MKLSVVPPRQTDYRFDPIPEVAEWENAFSGGDSPVKTCLLDLTLTKDLEFVALLHSYGDDDEELAKVLGITLEEFGALGDLESREEAIRASLAAKRLAVQRGLQSLSAFVDEMMTHDRLPWLIRAHLARAVRHAAADILAIYYDLERERIALTKPTAAT